MVAFCVTAPVKRSGIAEGPYGQRQFFSSSVDLFSLICLPWSTCADLRFTPFILLALICGQESLRGRVVRGNPFLPVLTFFL